MRIAAIWLCEGKIQVAGLGLIWRGLSEQGDNVNPRSIVVCVCCTAILSSSAFLPLTTSYSHRHHGDHLSPCSTSGFFNNPGKAFHLASRGHCLEKDLPPTILLHPNQSESTRKTSRLVFDLGIRRNADLYEENIMEPPLLKVKAVIASAMILNGMRTWHAVC